MESYRSFHSQYLFWQGLFSAVLSLYSVRYRGQWYWSTPSSFWIAVNEGLYADEIEESSSYFPLVLEEACRIGHMAKGGEKAFLMQLGLKMVECTDLPLCISGVLFLL